MSRVICCLAAIIGLVLCRPLAAAEQESFADRLAALAAKCDELNRPREAEITRGWIVPRHSGRQFLFLPASSDPAAPKDKADSVAAKWYARFREYRAEQA